MKIKFGTEEFNEYLSGNKLSNGESFSFESDKNQPVISRNELILSLCNNKNVLHVGCADHINLIKMKRTNGQYLHDRLGEVCNLLLGVDVNDEALRLMRSIGIENVYNVKELPENNYDIILIPDVIEHVTNVGDFLTSLKKYNAKTLIVTTPNAYRLINRKQFDAELINTDHHYWFSPYTLIKSLYGSGFVTTDIYFTDTLSWRHPLDRLRKISHPLCRDGLLVVASYPS